MIGYERGLTRSERRAHGSSSFGVGRGGGTRTRDLVLPKHVRCQLRHSPGYRKPRASYGSVESRHHGPRVCPRLKERQHGMDAAVLARMFRQVQLCQHVDDVDAPVHRPVARPGRNLAKFPPVGTWASFGGGTRSTSHPANIWPRNRPKQAIYQAQRSLRGTIGQNSSQLDGPSFLAREIGQNRRQELVCRACIARAATPGRSPRARRGTLRDVAPGA